MVRAISQRETAERVHTCNHRLCNRKFMSVYCFPTNVKARDCTHLSANQPNPHKTNSCQLYRPIPMSWMALFTSFDFTGMASVSQPTRHSWHGAPSHIRSPSTSSPYLPSSPLAVSPRCYTRPRSSTAYRRQYPEPWPRHPGRRRTLRPESLRIRSDLIWPSGCEDAHLPEE